MRLVGTDLGFPNGQAVQTIIPNNAAFQTKDQDTYDSDCDDISNAKAIVFDQIDAVVQQSSVDKQCLEIDKKELLLENDRLLQQIMSQDVLLTVMNYMSLICKSVNMDRKRKESCDKCFNLEAELLQNREAHINYLKYTQEQVDILRGIVEQAKAKQPLDKELDFASLAVGEDDELVTEKVLDRSMVRIQDIRSEDFQEEVKVNTAGTCLLHDIYVNTASINMDDTTAGHHCLIDIGQHKDFGTRTTQQNGSYSVVVY
ncbi:hypothetical protein Tco_0443408 [Tanacetum coccineum]